jgi:5'-nucleotidase
MSTCRTWPWCEVAGFEVTRLGNRHRAEAVHPAGRPARAPVVVDWRRPAPSRMPASGTDFHAVRTGHISITPIQVDLTRYQALDQVASWVDGLAASLKPAQHESHTGASAGADAA